MHQATPLVSTSLIAFAFAATLHAGQSRAVSVPERARGADDVVVARVTTVEPRFEQNAFGDRLIVSHVRLEVNERMKGPVAADVAFELEGGTIGELTLTVSDLPRLAPGDRAIFFLDRTVTGSHRPHLRGLGILPLDATNHVRGTTVRLDEVRALVQSAR